MTTSPQYASYPSLQERVVLVTGGASGIGASLVEAFWRQGAKVAFVDIDEDAADALCARLEGGSHAPWFLPVDLREIPALEEAIAKVHARWGAIQVLVNNAGWDERHALGTVTSDFWDKSMEINLRPHFFTVQAVMQRMGEAGGGSIINLSSNSWMLGVPGMPAYVAAKAGIIGLTRALARELGPHKIRVNAVLPGWVMTERQREKWLTPEAEQKLLEEQCLKQTIAPEDVACLVLFLAADDSRMITNQSYIIDGGRV